MRSSLVHWKWEPQFWVCSHTRQISLKRPSVCFIVFLAWTKLVNEVTELWGLNLQESIIISITSVMTNVSYFLLSYWQACSLDPLFDDSVEFAKRLHSLNNDVELYILDGLPHGFLGFHLVSQEAREGNNLCIVCLKRTLTGKRTKVNAEKPPVYWTRNYTLECI